MQEKQFKMGDVFKVTYNRDRKDYTKMGKVTDFVNYDDTNLIAICCDPVHTTSEGFWFYANEVQSVTFLLKENHPEYYL